MISAIIGISFLVTYFVICIYAEKAYNAMCIDFLNFVIENGNEKDQKRVSQLIGGHS